MLAAQFQAMPKFTLVSLLSAAPHGISACGTRCSEACSFFCYRSCVPSANTLVRSCCTGDCQASAQLTDTVGIVCHRLSHIQHSAESYPVRCL